MTPKQINDIEEEAAQAVGRRETRCQVAMADIYKRAGVLPMDLEIPNGDRDWANSQGRSLIEPWVDASPYFEPIETIEPGALLGFRLGHSLHHVAIALNGGRMVHVFGSHGVQIAACIPAPWAKRLERIWKIKQ